MWFWYTTTNSWDPIFKILPAEFVFGFGLLACYKKQKKSLLGNFFFLNYNWYKCLHLTHSLFLCSYLSQITCLENWTFRNLQNKMPMHSHSIHVSGHVSELCSISLSATCTRVWGAGNELITSRWQEHTAKWQMGPVCPYHSRLHYTPVHIQHVPLPGMFWNLLTVEEEIRGWGNSGCVSNSWRLHILTRATSLYRTVQINICHEIHLKIFQNLQYVHRHSL